MKDLTRYSKRMVTLCTLMLLGLAMMMGGIIVLTGNSSRETPSREIVSGNCGVCEYCLAGGNLDLLNLRGDETSTDYVWNQTSTNSFTFETVQQGYSTTEEIPITYYVDNYSRTQKVGCSYIPIGGHKRFDFYIVSSYRGATSFVVSNNFSLSNATYTNQPAQSLTLYPKVKSKTGLSAGTYYASLICVGSGGNIASELMPRVINFTITVRPLYYGISVGSAPTFPLVVENYAQPEGKPIRITNTGNTATGPLTLKLNNDNFQTSTSSTTGFSAINKNTATIPVGGSLDFWIRPRTGLTSGFYSGAVSIYNSNIPENYANTRNVYFQVGSGTWRISLAPSHDFGAILRGSELPAPREVTVTNMGDQATGTLNVTLSGGASTNFSMSGLNSGNTLASITTASPEKKFTVRPRTTDLAPKKYEETITVGGGSVPQQTITVKFTIVTFSVSLTGDLDFGSMRENYAEPPASRAATITNSGSESTGILKLELRGPNASNFRLNGMETTSIPITSIVSGSTVSVDVRPIARLSPGNHTATLALLAGTGNTNIKGEQTLEVKFTVMSFGITATPPKIDFGTKNAGYAATSNTVTVTNTGNQPTGELTIRNSTPAIFETPATLASIPASGTKKSTFSVKLAANAPSGTHAAEINIGNADVGWETVIATVVIKAPTVGITIIGDPNGGDSNIIGDDPNKGSHGVVGWQVGVSSSGAYSFPSRDLGYQEPPAAYAVSMANTGDQATGTMSVTLQGEKPNSFQLFGAPVSSIAPGSNGSFKVQPGPRLPAGLHKATVFISGTGVSIQFEVTFMVKSYGISLDQTDLTFSPVNYGDEYTPEVKTIVVTNIGNQQTGELSISSSNPSFKIIDTSLASITTEGGTASFTIQPVEGLAGATYTSTITVTGAKIPSQTLKVSFFVRVISVSLTPSSTSFPALDFGTNPNQLQPITATIKNTGNDLTGEISIVIRGTSSSMFIVSRTTLQSLAPDETATFTIHPFGNIAAGLHTATIAVTGNFPSKSFDVSLQVISLHMALSPDYIFPSMNAHYETPPAPHPVTIKNTGAMPTGALTIRFLDEASEAAYILSETSLGSLDAGQSISFTIQPITGLLAGTHYAAVLVESDQGLAAIFNAAFVVKTYKIGLSHSQLKLNPGVVGSYSSVNGTVTVYNLGTAETGLLNLSLSGDNANCFTLLRNSISNIIVGGNTTFVIKPTAGLLQGTYTTVVTVDGENISESRNVYIVFRIGGYGIQLSQAGLYNFEGGYQSGYASEQLNVTIKNIGELATGPMDIWLLGNGKNGFSLSSKNITSINQKNGTAIFDIQTQRGLKPGVYTVTVLVSGNNITSQSFDVTFTVYRYGCPCDNPIHHGDYSLLFIIPAILGIALLTWLGMRKLQVQSAIQMQSKNKDGHDLSNLLSAANRATAEAQEQAAAYIPPPSDISVTPFVKQPQPLPQPKTQPAVQSKPASIADQMLAQAKATVATKRAAQPTKATGTPPAAKQSLTARTSTPPKRTQEPEQNKTSLPTSNKTQS